MMWTSHRSAAKRCPFERRVVDDWWVVIDGECKESWLATAFHLMCQETFDVAKPLVDAQQEWFRSFLGNNVHNEFHG